MMCEALCTLWHAAGFLILLPEEEAVRKDGRGSRSIEKEVRFFFFFLSMCSLKAF